MTHQRKISILKNSETGSTIPPQSESVSGLNRSSSIICAKLDPFLHHYATSLVSGVGSGTLSSIACAPLDLVRTRMQVLGSISLNSTSGSQNFLVLRSIKNIYLKDGLHGCFRGLGATLMTVPFFWGIYFPLYEDMKRRLHRLSVESSGDDADYYSTNFKVAPWIHMSSAILAGGLADTVCNPMFVVRTRMQTEVLHNNNKNPMGIRDTIVGLWKEGGVPIFFRGLTASLLGLSHVAIQFPAYEYLKSETQEVLPSTPALLLSSGLSKVVASLITYPHEVIRSRMMDVRISSSKAAPSLIQTARTIVTQEGYSSLYSGLRVSLVRVVPNCCITFVSYETILKWMRA